MTLSRRFCIILYSLLSLIYYLKEICDEIVTEQLLLEKSLLFAARIVKLYRYLSNEKKETVISKQIIRSGTSIGANANEAVYGISKADFVSKLHISLKETAETEYWLRLLQLSGYINDDEAQSLIDDCVEIKRILISTLKTAKDKTNDLISRKPYRRLNSAYSFYI